MTESSEQMAAAVKRLEQCFRDVYETRMQGLPIVNRALEVRAMGFRQWHEYWFGVLLTPWFINLVLLPRENTTVMPGVGDSCKLSFPSGEFVFLGCYEDATGQFLSCSLLSPVNGVDSQQHAESIIEEALQEIFKEPPAENNSDEVGYDKESYDEESKEVRRFQVNAAIMKLTAEENSNEIAGVARQSGESLAIESAGHSDNDISHSGPDITHSGPDINSSADNSGTTNVGTYRTSNHSLDIRRDDNNSTGDERVSQRNELKTSLDRVESLLRPKSSSGSKKERMSRRKLFARMVGRDAAQQKKQKKLENTDPRGAQQ